MGYEVHDAVLVSSNWATVDDQPEGFPAIDIAAFRESMPEWMRRLLVGPIPHVANGGETYLFAPDGSKEGWGPSDEAAEWRERFKALFAHTYSDGSTPWDVVHVRYGGDAIEEGGSRVLWSNDRTEVTP